MKRSPFWAVATTALLLLAPAATAGGMTISQELKAAGLRPNATLEQVKTEQADDQMRALADEQLPDERCGHPIEPDVEIALATVDEISLSLDVDAEHAEALKQMHRRLAYGRNVAIALDAIDGFGARTATTGAGSWRVGCNDDWPDRHAVYYHVNRDSFPSDNFKDIISDADLQGYVDTNSWGIKDLAHAKRILGGKTNLDVGLIVGLQWTYARRGILMLETDDRDKAQIRIYSKFISGSTIGYAYFNDTRCNDRVNHVIDSSWRPRKPAHSYARLFGHEGGHNNNLEHQFRRQQTTRAVMGYTPPSSGLYYGFSEGTIAGAPPLDPSVAILDRFFGSDPFPYTALPIHPGSDDPITPPPPPTGGWPPKVGDVASMQIAGTNLQLLITAVGGNPPPPNPRDLKARCIAALAKIPEYAAKKYHRQVIGLFYAQTADLVESGGRTVEEAKAGLTEIQQGIAGDKADDWAELFAIMDTASNHEHLRQIGDALVNNEALPPELIAIITAIVNSPLFDNFPFLKVMIPIILQLLGNLDQEAAIEAEGAGDRPAVCPEPVGANLLRSPLNIGEGLELTPLLEPELRQPRAELPAKRIEAEPTTTTMIPPSKAANLASQGFAAAEFATGCAA